MLRFSVVQVKHWQESRRLQASHNILHILSPSSSVPGSKSYTAIWVLASRTEVSSVLSHQINQYKSKPENSAPRILWFLKRKLEKRQKPFIFTKSSVSLSVLGVRERVRPGTTDFTLTPKSSRNRWSVPPVPGAERFHDLSSHILKTVNLVTGQNTHMDYPI